MKNLVMLALLVALAMLVVKAMEMMKEWEGLPEAEVRARLERKLAPYVPPEQLTEILDGVVTKMRQRGKLGDAGPAEA